jgi:alpha-L-fucosidase
MKDTIKMCRKLQPDVMFRARGIGNYGDYYTPEGVVPGDPSLTAMPWMVIYPLGRTFSYEAEAKFHKGTKWIVHNLIDCAAKGGAFMVGIGPDKLGTWHPEAVRQLEATGDWLRTNGEGIYNTRAWIHWKDGPNVRFTRSKDQQTIYIHLLEWPGARFETKLVQLSESSKITLLANQTELQWNIDHGRLTVELPETQLGQYAWVLRVQNNKTN